MRSKRKESHTQTQDTVQPDCISITRKDHNISKTNISINALKVVNRLNKCGYDAYLVGGSVRDLLLHKTPKDFDIATNAKPNEIKKLFKNCRIIGRRFRLAHILFHREIIEVATFRSNEPESCDHQTAQSGMIVRDNVYGTIEQDAWRRDFTLNALYYDVNHSSILDFTGGFNDINNNTISIIGDAHARYTEDPVRMIRAIRFSAKLNFNLSPETAVAIPQLAHLIQNVSHSRMFDEVAKLFHCGNAVTVLKLLQQYGLFHYLFPLTDTLTAHSYPFDALFHHFLENTDNRIAADRTVTPAFLFAVVLWFPVLQQSHELEQEGLAPLPAFEKAASIIIAKQSKITSIPKRYSIAMREMWILQHRFPKRFGVRPYKILEHPRFRAAYDLLLLRALAGDESVELAEWWSSFQEVTPDEQRVMLKQLNGNRRRKRNPKA